MPFVFDSPFSAICLQARVLYCLPCVHRFERFSFYFPVKLSHPDIYARLCRHHHHQSSLPTLSQFICVPTFIRCAIAHQRHLYPVVSGTWHQVLLKTVLVLSSKQLTRLRLQRHHASFVRADIEEINCGKSLHNAHRESRIHAFHRKRIITLFLIHSILRATVIRLLV